MRNYSILFILTSILLISCVKDPTEIAVTQLFSVKINSQDINNALITADNSLVYKIDIEQLEGIEIDNDKEVNVSVSDGTLATTTDLSSNSNATQITLIIQGGKGTFYFFPGTKAKLNAILAITLQGLSQVFNFVIHPSEPSFLELSTIPEIPHVNDELQLTAFLIKNSSDNSLASENLKILFDAQKADPLETIEPFVSAPKYANSILNIQTGLVSANLTLTTNQQPGKIIISATYIPVQGEPKVITKTVEFLP